MATTSMGRWPFLCPRGILHLAASLHLPTFLASTVLQPPECRRPAARPLRSRLQRAGLAALVLLALCTIAPAPARGAWRVADGEGMRWRGIHRQETSRTCGPASLVTLLEYYFHVPATEEEVARRALGWGDAQPPPGALDQPATMRGLRDALAHWGFAAYGLEMSASGLRTYLDEVGVPVLVRILYPEPHFTLVAGHAGGHFLLADSALGWWPLAEGDLLAVWDGVALVVDPRSVPPGAGAWPSRREAARLAQRLGHLRRGLAR